MLEKMWGKGNTPPLMVGMKTGTTALEISMAISQKIRKLSQDPEIPLFGKYPKNAESYQKDIHVFNYAHSSIICHSHNLETT